MSILDTNYRLDKSDPGGEVIDCHNGTIGTWSETQVVASVNKPTRALQNQLKRLCGTLYNDGDDGQNWLFPSRYLPSLCRIMRARRS